MILAAFFASIRQLAEHCSPAVRQYRRAVPVFLSTILAASGIGGVGPQPCTAASWPQFRGPSGDGQVVGEPLPLTWSEDKNVRWRTPIHGKGWSSPVIDGDRIWLTTATEEGHEMYVVCVRRSDGEVLLDRKVFSNSAPRFCHPTNSYASPTPAIHEGRIYVHFGSYGTACLDGQSGETIWSRRDLPCDHWRGPASSPIIFDGKLFVSFDGYDVQYQVALDCESGATLWNTDRNIDYGTDNGDHRKAYGTCHVVRHGPAPIIVSPSAAETIAYNPNDGTEHWRVRHGGMNAATRPLWDPNHRLVFLTIGDPVGRRKPTLLAVRPDVGLDDGERIAWTVDRSAPRRSSPVLVDDLLFMISDDGIASCLDVATGETHWRKRVAGSYRASLIASHGRVYFSSLEGVTTVVAASSEFQVLATNELGAGFQASPAASEGQLVLRSTQALYAIEE